MKIEKIDILSNEVVQKADCICFTSNGILKSNGCLVMGAGVALAFARKFPWLPIEAGNAVKEFGNSVNVFWDEKGKINIVSFPTKYHWRSPSDLNLIAQSAEELMGLIKDNDWRQVYLPFPGVNNGGLDRRDVLATIDPIFDDRVILCYI